ncbi:meprin A subunit beta-like [Lineus longissimus]|uniref:meprin A subunit beta-like n=1 Tax=Lineus longissimus TaxID=88925 RepID=UPI002B4F957C
MEFMLVSYLLLGAACGFVDKEFEKKYRRVDATTFVNRETGEVYEPESAGYYQGDMRFPGEGDDSSMKRNVPFDLKIWPDGIVPYSFDPSLKEEKYLNLDWYKNSILKAISIIETKTCIRYVEWTDQPHRINFVREKGCTSFVGQQTAPSQNVDIGPGCGRIGVVLHELLHALGFNHEHERADREGIVAVNMSNVEDDRKMWFTIRPMKLIGEYDVDSIMHYGSSTFSKDFRYKTLIQLKDFDKGYIGQRDHLSVTDIKEINDLYDCGVITTTPTTTTPAPVGVVASCDFDDGSFCDFKGLGGSASRWGVTKEGGDHAGSGSFATFQVASNEVKSFERNSALFVAKLEYGKTYCLTFWYRVRGSGSIDVKIRNVMVERMNVKLGEWTRGRLTIAPPEKYDDEARIMARVDKNQHGNVDLDDVEVMHGSC